MVPSSSGSGSRPAPLPQLPDWVSWLQAGLTALLTVLFLVMLAKARTQGARIEELQQRLQGLENSRALERTTGLEQQLRSTVERLQALERSSARIDLITTENEALRGELRQLRRNAAAKPPAARVQPESASNEPLPAPAQPSIPPLPPVPATPDPAP